MTLCCWQVSSSFECPWGPCMGLVSIKMRRRLNDACLKSSKVGLICWISMKFFWLYRIIALWNLRLRCFFFDIFIDVMLLVEDAQWGWPIATDGWPFSQTTQSALKDEIAHPLPWTNNYAHFHDGGIIYRRIWSVGLMCKTFSLFM